MKVDLEALERIAELTYTPRAKIIRDAIAELRELREAREWRNAQDRPADGTHVAYLFEPFGTYHVGLYDAASDSVCGKSGFTTWQPEVTAWFPLPARAATKEPA